MTPNKEELIPYVEDRKTGAQRFEVSERTFIRWLQEHNLYRAKPNYGAKLSKEQTEEIRNALREGLVPRKELAKRYKISEARISKIAKEQPPAVIGSAIVSVIYNPNTMEEANTNPGGKQ